MKKLGSWFVGIFLTIYAIVCGVLVMTLANWSLIGGSDERLVLRNTQLPDLSQIQQAPERVQLFLDTLRPLIEQKNLMMLASRQQLLQIKKSLTETHQLTEEQAEALKQFRADYFVSTDDYPKNSDAIEILLLRVDMIPTSMVLAQAAIESGWGTSTFAREGNNLFGEWCYTKGCGIVPANRPANAKYEVRKFASIEDSLDAYYRNINTHYAYRSLRDLRAKIRKTANQFTGSKLVDGLGKYCGRGNVYIAEVKTLIRSTGLESPVTGLLHPDLTNPFQNTVD